MNTQQWRGKRNGLGLSLVQSNMLTFNSATPPVILRCEFAAKDQHDNQNAVFFIRGSAKQWLKKTDWTCGGPLDIEINFAVTPLMKTGWD